MNYKKQLINKKKIVNNSGIDKFKMLLGLFLLVCRFIIPEKMSHILN